MVLRNLKLDKEEKKEFITVKQYLETFTGTFEGYF